MHFAHAVCSCVPYDSTITEIFSTQQVRRLVFIMVTQCVFCTLKGKGKVVLSRNLASQSRAEAGSNTSTVALRVVGGDERGTQCLGV
jgi:hypothetical protein